MPELGGLKDKNDVKILILFLLKNINYPLTITNISDILIRYGQANYFDITDGLEELVSNFFAEKIENEDGVTHYHPTGQGIKFAEELYSLLPSSVREKTMRSALKTLSNIKRESQIITDLQKTDYGYLVNCQIKDEELDIFKFSLYVPNDIQAHIVQKNFKNNPEYIYKSLIELLTKEDENDN